MLVDLGVKSLAKSDGVGVIKCADGSGFVAWSEPEMNPVKKVKAGPVHQAAADRLVFRAEEDGRGKNPLKTLYHSSVIATILGESEELQHLRGAIEMDRTALLPKGEGCYPDGDEAILAEGQAKIRMCDNLQEEFTVPALVKDLPLWKRAQWKAAQGYRLPRRDLLWLDVWKCGRQGERQQAE